VDAGRVDVQNERFRIAPTGAFTSPEDIGNLAIIGETLDEKVRGARSGHAGEIIRIKDFATIRRGYIQPPVNLMFFNGMPSVGISLAAQGGVNVVEVGEILDKRLKEVIADLPTGIEVHRMAWQADDVSASITSFMINLIEAIVIVLIVLALSMGIRMGMIIGLTGLIFAVLGSFIMMWLLGIDLQRISLGALIIAMGMMVDNAIVVADGFQVRLQEGKDRIQAAIESASLPAMPLLGATVVAAMAFFPIFMSKEDSGEYAGSLFTVVASALLLSWLLSQTLTPLLCIRFIPDPKKGKENKDPYGGKFYGKFRAFLGWSIRHRVIVIIGMVALLLFSFFNFQFVEQMFFPDSSRHQFMIDYWLPEGTRIEQVVEDLQPIAKRILEDERVESVTSFIGKGPPRFYLPVDPEMNYAAYGQLIVNTKSLDGLLELVPKLLVQLDEDAPHAVTRVRKYGVGSFDDWKFEARFSGPAEADPAILRSIGEEGMAILKASPLAREVRINWRQRVREIVPGYSQERGRWANVSRSDIADATRRSHDGVTVGLFREGDDLIPIVVRQPEDERARAASDMAFLQVVPPSSRKTVPLSQVIDGIDVVWEDPIIWRWNRRRAITVQCSPNNCSAPELRSSIIKDFEAIKLPPGYSLEWGGEYDSSQDAQKGLIPGLIPTLVIMSIIIMVLFNAFRPPIIIVLVIPFAAIGIIWGLLLTGIPFGFMSLLGAMSLAGMMIKNSVVLLDQVNINQDEGMSPYRAVVEAAVSRLRPVVNAAATTVLGMAPLLQDVFWVSMAITIMAGLAFGTLLTMVLIPIFYATLYKIRGPNKQ